MLLATSMLPAAIEARAPFRYAPRREARLMLRELEPPGPRPPKLLDCVRKAVRLRPGSRSTEKAYVRWIRCYIARRYPNAGREWLWHWVFTATRYHTDRATGQRRRRHLHETVLQRTVIRAARRGGSLGPER